MKKLKYSDNYNDVLFAELYDRDENHTDDVQLLLRMLAGKGSLRILECFAGTGRIALPLAKAGHQVTGIDIAQAMIDRARMKAAALPLENQAQFIVADVLEEDWGRDYDMVIIGCNAFYELPSAEMQERCIKKAAASLKQGGYFYVDNDNYRGNWGKGLFGQERVYFSGIAADGTQVKFARVDESFDETNRVLTMQRVVYKQLATGEAIVDRSLGRKRPVTGEEVRGWLEANHFTIVQAYGNWRGDSFTPESDRAIFFARLAE